VAGVSVAAGLGQADRDRRPQPLAHEAGLAGGSGQAEGAARDRRTAHARQDAADRRANDHHRQ
jgi:hypothetical protein